MQMRHILIQSLFTLRKKIVIVHQRLLNGILLFFVALYIVL